MAPKIRMLSVDAPWEKICAEKPLMRRETFAMLKEHVHLPSAHLQHRAAVADELINENLALQPKGASVSL